MRTALALLCVAAALSCVWLLGNGHAVVPTVMSHEDREAEEAPVAGDSSAVEREQVAEDAPDVQRDVSEEAIPTVRLVLTPWLARFLVVDEDERPVADAVVALWPGIRNSADGASLELRTDSGGRAAAMIEKDRVFAVAHKSGAGWSAEGLLSRTDASGQVLLVLEAEHVLRGRVLGIDGLPVAGAHVAAHVASSGGLLGHVSPPQAVHSGERGTFELPVRRGVAYEVRAYAANQQSLIERVGVRSEPPGEVVLVFAGAITIRGRVLDARGQPVACAPVAAWCEGDAGFEPARVWSGSDGGFEISVKRYARYQLVASGSQDANSSPVTAHTSIERPHADVVLRLQEKAIIAGVVLGAHGEPLSSVRLTAEPEGSKVIERGKPSRSDLFGPRSQTTTDDAGRFECAVCPGATYALVVVPDAINRFNVVRRSGVMTGSRNVEIRCGVDELAGCTVHGTVMRTDGLPLGPLKVSVRRLEEKSWSSWDVDVAIDDGAFTMPALPLGDRFGIVVVSAVVSARVAPCYVGPLTMDRRDMHVQFRLEPWAEVPVRVLDTSGAPVRLAQVGWSPDPPDFRNRGSGGVDSEGCVLLTRVTPGLVLLHVGVGSREPVRQEVRVVSGRNAEIVVRLPVEATRR